MPMLKKGTDLSGASAWAAQWCFSQLPPSNPRNFPKAGHGFRYDGPDNYKKQELRTKSGPLVSRDYLIKHGMQGVICMVATMSSVVEFQNFVDKDGRRIQCWIPNVWLTVSEKPFPGQWKIAYSHDSTPNVPRPDVYHDENSEREYDLYPVISTYLSACKDSTSKFMPDDFIRKLGPQGEYIPRITTSLCDAFDRRDMYALLSRGDWDIDDIKSKCPKLDDTGRIKHHKKWVIYFIWYREPDTGKTHLYVGKTVDIDSRITRYNVESTNPKSDNYNSYHHKLRRACEDSESRYMGILADLGDEGCYKDLNGIAEQLAVSILGTYRPALGAIAAKVDVGDLLIDHGSVSAVSGHEEPADMLKVQQRATEVEHFMLFSLIARRTFEACDYPGGIDHRNIGVEYGVNWNSPLPGAFDSTSYTPNLWIKSSFWQAIEDINDVTTVKFANYTKAKKTSAHWMRNKKDEYGRTRYWYTCSFFHGPYHKGAGDRKLLILAKRTPEVSSDVGVYAVIDDTKWPAHRQAFTTTIEVREDFRMLLPWGISSLPLMGPYKDWSRANSWSFKVQWEDSLGSPRQHYFQYEDACSKFLDATKPGTQTAYDLGMAISRWIVGDDIQNEGKEWMREYTGRMRAREKVYDFLTWTISFQIPGQSIGIPSGRRLTEQEQIAEMQSFRFQGQQLLAPDVAGTRKSLVKTDARRGGSRAVRQKCDTCYMINDKDCVKVQGQKYCENCFKFGLLICPWSQGTPQASYASWKQLDKQNPRKLRSEAIRAALLDQKPFNYEQDGGTAGFHLNFQLLENNLDKDERESLLRTEERGAEELDE